MRLIDADKLIDNLEWLNENDYILFDEVKETVKNTPTVKAIPIDKPFLKMRYGDYVCYNRNWLMKHLPMELDILQGKAIPIEWINKWVITTNMGAGRTIDRLLEDWEKENEQNKENASQTD